MLAMTLELESQNQEEDIAPDPVFWPVLYSEVSLTFLASPRNLRMAASRITRMPVIFWFFDSQLIGPVWYRKSLKSKKQSLAPP